MAELCKEMIWSLGAALVRAGSRLPCWREEEWILVTLVGTKVPHWLFHVRKALTFWRKACNYRTRGNERGWKVTTLNLQTWGVPHIPSQGLLPQGQDSVLGGGCPALYALTACHLRILSSRLTSGLHWVPCRWADGHWHHRGRNQLTYTSVGGRWRRERLVRLVQMAWIKRSRVNAAVRGPYLIEVMYHPWVLLVLTGKLYSNGVASDSDR